MQDNQTVPHTWITLYGTGSLNAKSDFCHCRANYMTALTVIAANDGLTCVQGTYDGA
jgi:hypothetical protein